MLTTTLPPTLDAPQWSAAKRFGFRIVFTYLILSHVETFLGLLIPVFRITGSPGNLGPRALYRIPWDRFAAWIGVQLFSVDPVLLVPVNGGMDSAINYARASCFLLTAIVVAVAWSAVDKRRQHVGLHQWLTDFLRYALAIDLFAYGVNKVIPVQMLPGHLFTTYLIQPFGDKSPAGLLWAFVGYSVPYQVFSGAVEVLSALLLLNRRTVAVGALLSLVATVNVVLLNFCYDVNLKLYSSHLLAAAIFLAWPVVATIVRLFVFHQPVAPPAVKPSRRTEWPLLSARAAFAVLVAVNAYQGVVGAYAEFRLQAGLPTTTPLYGIYDVERFGRNSQDVPPLTTDHRRWRRMVMESPRVVRVERMDDSFESYRVEYDEAVMQLRLFTDGQSDAGGVFAWSVPDADHLELNGRLDGDEVLLSLRRIDRSTFPLMKTGFHWIQRQALIQ